METKRILFLLRHSPYGSNRAVEAAESALVAGVFEQEVSVLFKDDGVWQLVSAQDGHALGTRTVGKVLGALPEYDVERLFVCESSLEARRLSAADLVLDAQPLGDAEQQALLARQHVVVSD
tara:strand:- start:30307 stop:30669 length:363 start_codon:yes stop_codon:yes gene_type:complete